MRKLSGHVVSRHGSPVEVSAVWASVGAAFDARHDLPHVQKFVVERPEAEAETGSGQERSLMAEPKDTPTAPRSVRGRHEGSIWQRKDCRWEAAIRLGFANGRVVRKSFYGKTRRAVADKLNAALARQQRGANVNTNDALTVAVYLDRWLSTVAVRPKTKRQYEQVVRLYLKPAIGPTRLARLEPDQVRALVQGLEQRGLSPRTATLSRDVLRIALAQAVRDEMLARNVAILVRRPKGTRREGPTLSDAEARALLDALAGERLDAVVTCGVALGLRQGEVLGLQWADLDLSVGRLTVRRALQTMGKHRELVDVKSRESRRTIALPAFVVQTLKQHRVAQGMRRLEAGGKWQPSDFVFTTRVGRPLDGTLVTRDLKRILTQTWIGGRADCRHPQPRRRERVCLDCDAVHLPVISFHGLRHSCASLLLAAGVPIRDVSELLGHSDVRLTLSSYAHVLDENRARMAGVIDRVFDRAVDGKS
jgi:integrase